MKISSLQFRALSVAIFCAIAPVSPAQTTATTDPVGFVTVALAANSDSYVFIPFKRTPVYAGAASAAISANAIPVSGTPFTDSQFVYVAVTQPNHYYVFLNSGPKAGSYYSVTGNATNSVSIDANGDDLSAVIVAGTNFQIIPYDTLGTIFPVGKGVDASAGNGVGARQTEVLIPDNATAGTDLALPVSYYYNSNVTAPGAGWRKAGVSGVLANDDILYPDQFFVVRNKAASAGNTLTFTGTVQMATLSTPVGTNAVSVNQDNAVALPIAANLNLAESKIWESGAFLGSASHGVGSRGDQILVYDNSITGRDKGADFSYYYYTGTTAPGPGWRKAGVSGTVADTDVIVKPGFGLVIRKKSTGPVLTSIWSVKPPYVP